MVGNNSLLEKYISLTFDEDPKVRKMAAEKLANIDDPAATFALLELCYDKNEEVREVARKALNIHKPGIHETVSLSDIFSSQQEQEKKQNIDDEEQTMLNIEKLFDKKLGKDATDIKKKMLPTIKKLLFNAAKANADSTLQEMLPQYLDIVSKIKKINESEEKNRVEERKEEVERNEQIESDESEIDEIGSGIKEGRIAKEVEEVMNIDGIDEEPIKLVDDNSIPSHILKVFMLSGGDEQVLNQEIKRIRKKFEEELEIAVRLAKKRFKKHNITKLSELKDGMRNVNTSILLVKDVKRGTYQKSKRKIEQYLRILVEDESGAEGVVYLFGGRGKEILPGMKIKVEKGIVKTFSFSGETAIAVPKKGYIYIVV
jgi:hypothetical protein